jgi:hypothetical protein
VTEEEKREIAQLIETSVLQSVNRVLIVGLLVYVVACSICAVVEALI